MAMSPPRTHTIESHGPLQAPLISADRTTTARLVEHFGKLPLNFEENHGQTDAGVKFLSRGDGYSLFLTPTEAVIALQQKAES